MCIRDSSSIVYKASGSEKKDWRSATAASLTLHYIATDNLAMSYYMHECMHAVDSNTQTKEELGRGVGCGVGGGMQEIVAILAGRWRRT